MVMDPVCLVCGDIHDLWTVFVPRDVCIRQVGVIQVEGHIIKRFTFNNFISILVQVEAGRI